MVIFVDTAVRTSNPIRIPLFDLSYKVNGEVISLRTMKSCGELGEFIVNVGSSLQVNGQNYDMASFAPRIEPSVPTEKVGAWALGSVWM